MLGSIEYESKDFVATVTINRPEKHNALTVQMAHDLRGAWERFSQSGDRVAVVTGAGDAAFTAGADIQEMRDPNVPGWVTHQVVPGVFVNVDKPIISAVGGWCVGAGFYLMQATDLCVAADNAVFSYPEPRIGLAGGRVPSMVARIPHKIAMELVMLCEPMDAHRAYATGVINEVVEKGTQVDRAQEMAAKIASHAPLAIQMIKRHVTAFGPQAIPERAASVVDEVELVMTSKDRAEGLQAFLDGREPDFRGS